MSEKPNRNTRKALAKIGVRLSDNMIVYTGEVGRDTLYVWLDRVAGKDRTNAAVRSPSRWVHVTQVAPETLGGWGNKPVDLIDRFSQQVFCAMQGRPLSFEYADVATVFGAMKEDVQLRRPKLVQVVNFDAMTVNRPQAYRDKQPLQKPGHTTLFCQQHSRRYMTWVPFLYFESDKYRQLLTRHHYKLVGGISDHGEDFVYRDGVIEALNA